MNFKHFVALNVADVLTTWYALAHIYGLGEANPIYSYTYDKIGLLPGLLLIKLVLLGVIWTIYTLPSLNKKIMDNYNITYKKAGINMICVIFMLVPLNNLFLIIKAIFYAIL